mgnify:CR=1 FL=1
MSPERMVVANAIATIKNRRQRIYITKLIGNVLKDFEESCLEHDVCKPKDWLVACGILEDGPIKY